MQTTAKYLIHATVRTSGVVERSDVVGAIFGQTEGLLGDQLDLRDLQEASKVGRIDVTIESEGGRSIGSITIASGLDKVETAVLAAALETIDRVGPCHADCTIADIEDARAAKRRTIVDRATDLLDELEERTVTTEKIVEEVRQNARVEEITTYEGYPAGPNVETSDAIIVVEGRADVRRLLKYGFKTAVAVEGTDIPAEIAELTTQRNTTAFLDGDRGGDLILRELQQVGDVDYVSFAPTDRSVEDLDKGEILSALRRKVPLDQVTDDQTPRDVFCPAIQNAPDTEEPDEAPAESTPEETVVTDGDSPAARETQTVSSTDPDTDIVEPSVPDADASAPATETTPDAVPAESPAETDTEDVDTDTVEADTDDASDDDAANEEAVTDEQTAPATLGGHVEAVIGSETGTARFLDEEFDSIDEVDAEDAFDALLDSEQVPETVVIDGTLTQKLLDGVAQRGVGQVVAAEFGNFVKQPTDVRIRTAAELEVEA
jgi:DNA primase